MYKIVSDFAMDCSILTKFGSECDHATSDVLQTSKSDVSGQCLIMKTSSDRQIIDPIY